MLSDWNTFVTTNVAIRGAVWIGVGAFVWWSVRGDHLRRERSPWARVRSAPRILRLMCGVPSAETVHVPVAILQVTAIAFAGFGVAFFLRPAEGRLYLNLAVLTMVAGGVAYAGTEVAAYLWMRRQRPRR